MKFSHQRALIKEILKGRSDHPTADMVYAAARLREPSISLGTVYRNLTMLADNGIILRLTGYDKDHFDGDIRPHGHFFCEKCKKIHNVFTASSDAYVKKAEDELGCEVSGINVSIRGICAECAKNNEK